MEIFDEFCEDSKAFVAKVVFGLMNFVLGKWVPTVL